MIPDTEEPDPETLHAAKKAMLQEKDPVHAVPSDEAADRYRTVCYGCFGNAAVLGEWSPVSF